jgi:hypothetical protein
MRRRRLAVLAVTLVVLGTAAACARAPGTFPVETGVTFALHAEHGAFVVDRMRDGATGVLAAPGWLPTPNAPALVLRTDGDVRAALWRVGQSRVLVREGESTLAPRTGEVLSSWEDGAVRLALWARDGATLRTDTFRREQGTGPPLLSRDARIPIGVGGTYRATVRDAGDAAVGWMRAQIGEASRAYDAVLPRAVDDGLAAAAAVALDAEIGWIEEHAVDTRRSEEQQRGDHHAERHAGGEHTDGDLRDPVEAAPDGPRGPLRHALHPVRLENLDVLLGGRRQRLDALLGVGRDRRDGLLNLIRGERGERELKEEDERGGREPHGHGA